MLIEPEARAHPRNSRRRALDLEAERLQSTLKTFDKLREMARKEPDETRAKDLVRVAWDAVERAEPVRVFHAQKLLDVSRQTIRDWMHKGVLKQEAESPARLKLATVLDAKDAVDELREMGKDQNLVSAVLSRLEGEALSENDRFRESVEQMKRGERGSWPERWGDV